MIKHTPLVSARRLTNLISVMERQLPGYWWSISQTSKDIYLSFGPSLYCPSAEDRIWSDTRDGDKGRQWSIKHGSADTDLIRNFMKLMINIEQKRVSFRSFGGPIPPQKGPPRVQSLKDLLLFEQRYDQFLKETDEVREKGIILRELYIGSCELSVDVSIRGPVGDDDSYDFSYDLGGDAILADALEAATADFLISCLGEDHAVRA